MPESDSNPWLLDGDPDRVRPNLKMSLSGSWSVFKTIAVNGSRAIGISPKQLLAGAALVVYDGLLKDFAERAAAGYHR